MFLISSAHAACGKDTDCKGDRICDAGTCRDPAPQGSEDVEDFEFGESGKVEVEGVEPADRVEAVRTYSDSAIRRAQEERRVARRGQIMGNSFAIPGAVVGLTMSALGATGAGDSVGAPVAGGLGLVSIAIGGGLAAGGGAAARSGLARLDGDQPGEELRITGWMGYAGAMALGAGAIYSGVHQSQVGGRRYEEAAATTGALGVTASLLGLTGDLLLAADAGVARRALEDRIDEVSDEARASRSPATDAPSPLPAPRSTAGAVRLAPFVAPTVGGCALGATGTF